MITQVLNLPYKVAFIDSGILGATHCPLPLPLVLCNYICPTCKIHSPSQHFPEVLAHYKISSNPDLVQTSSAHQSQISSLEASQSGIGETLGMIHHDTNFFSICEPSNQMMSYLLPKKKFMAVGQAVDNRQGDFHSKGGN